MRTQIKPCKECKLIKPLGELTGLCSECLDWQFHDLVIKINESNERKRIIKLIDNELKEYSCQALEELKQKIEGKEKDK